MKKRVLSTVLIGAMAMTLFAGCGSDSKKEAADSGDTTKTADTSAAKENGDGHACQDRKSVV